MPNLELHVHTKAGSADSSITVDALGRYAVERDTGAVVVTEHFRVWADWERQSFFDRWGVRVYRAIEVTTDAGHIIVIGPDHGTSFSGSAAEVLRVVRAHGWYAVIAHPFRHYYDDIHASQRPAFPSGLDAAELASSPIFESVHAIEIENGACTEDENALAAEVAMHLQSPATVGSDAHDPGELGRNRLTVPAIPRDEAELVDLLSGLALPNLERAASGAARRGS